MLILNDICVQFQQGKPSLKVDKICLEQGFCTAIIGTNGAGKSTLFNVISGELMPQKGSVLLNGKKVSTFSSKQKSKTFATVVQDPRQGTFEDLSIFENMAFAAARGERSHIKSIFKKSQKRLFAEKLSILGMGLEDRLNARVGSLSGGQRQALSLIMATLQTPKVLLLDEPTAALDPAMAIRVMEIIQKLTKDLNLTTLMITHNLEHAANYTEDILVMNAGIIEKRITKKVSALDLAASLHQLAA